MKTPWHRLSLFGKVLLFLVGFGFGMAAGLKVADQTKSSNSGNSVNVEVSGKVKRGSDVNIKLDSKQDQKEEPKKGEDPVKWWHFF